MKAWRIEAEVINKRRNEGSKEPSARVQMQQRKALSKMYKPAGSGNWLLDGMLLRGGFKAAVYGDPFKLPHGKEVTAVGNGMPSSPLYGAWFQTAVNKVKSWWNK